MAEANKDGHASRVEVTRYLNPRQYLLDIFEERKAHDPSFSAKKWAENLTSVSRSSLRLILSGRRAVHPKMVDAFARELGLTPQDAAYFAKIVQMGWADGDSKRREAEGAVSALISDGEEVPASDDFLCSALGPKLMALLSLDDVEKTSRGLAALLRWNESAVVEALGRLRAAGLAEQDDAGSWSPTVPHFFVKDLPGSRALQSYHRTCLREAITGIELPKETRRYRNALLTLSRDEFETLYSEMAILIESLVRRFAKTSGKGHVLYQMNFNLIPVAGPIAGRRVGERGSDMEPTEAAGQ